MKILLVNGGCLDRTGVCLFTYQWAHTLSVSYPGNSITVYFKRKIIDRALQKDFEDDGVKIVEGNHSTGGTFSDKENMQGIIQDLRTIFLEKYDIVHIHSSVIGFTALVLREAVRAKVPVRIAHAHGKFEENRLKKCIHDIFRGYIRRKSTVYAGCSRQSGLYLFGNNGLNSDKWRIVPNVIRTDNFLFNKESRDLHRNEIGVFENEILMGAVGYLETVKNHTFLIDVMDELKQRRVPAKLIVLGEGGLRETLSLKIQSLGLENDITLYGKTDDIPGWMSAMDLYLMPSLSEGLPISAIEAQASGLTCILSDGISGDVDIIPSLCHLPVDQGRDIWVEKIEEVFKNEKQSNESDRLRAARIVAEAGFDVSAFKDIVGNMYGLSG